MKLTRPWVALARSTGCERRLARHCARFLVRARERRGAKKANGAIAHDRSARWSNSLQQEGGEDATQGAQWRGRGGGRKWDS